MSKANLGDALWLREVAPSNELRKWFGHRPERWDDFRRRYRAEVRSGEPAAAFARLVDLARRGPVTLLYSARDEEHNQALALKELVDEHVG